MAVDKLVPSGNATDTGSILTTNDASLIDETVASADGSINDSVTNDITGNNAQWSLTSLSASPSSVNSATFRVRARVLAPAGSDDTCTYRFRCTVNATNYDITYSQADVGSGFIDRTISVGTGFTEAQYNAATVQFEQTAYAKTKGGDNLQCDIDAFELEVDYNASTVSETDADATGAATVSGLSGADKETDADAAGSATPSIVSGADKETDALVPGSTNTYYFDGSDEAATGTNWSSPTNSTNGSTADGSQIADPNTDTLQAGGTTAPASGDNIASVRVRFFYFLSSYDSLDMAINTDGAAETLASPSLPTVASPQWSGYTTLAVPSGGWTWAKVQALEFVASPQYTSGDGVARVNRIDVDVITYGGGAATVDGQAAIVLDTDGSSAGTSSASADTEVLTGTDADASGTSAVSGDANAIWAVDADTSSAASVSGDTDTIFASTGSSDGSATVSGDGEDAASGTVIETDADSSGAATVSGDAATVLPSDADSSGAATVSGISGSDKQVDADTSSSATVSGDAATVLPSDADASGSATISGDTDTLIASDGSSDGVATVTSVTGADKEVDANSSGVATVSGIGEDANAGTTDTDADAAGSATVSGVSETVSVKETDADAAGSAVVSGDTNTIFASTSASSGLANVSGVSETVTVNETDADAIGIATVSGDTCTIWASVANSLGSSVGTGVSGATVSTDMATAGSSIVLGVGELTGTGPYPHGPLPPGALIYGRPANNGYVLVDKKLIGL